MATATKKSRPAKQQVADKPGSASMEFLIYQDNGGSHHWTIVTGDGVTLVRSSGFASHDEAEQAAEHVRDNAASARFELHRGEAVEGWSARH